MRILDQQRAKFAWEKVGDAPRKDYVALAKAAPSLVMGNGLMQTLAFYQNKGGPADRLKDQIIEWLGKSGIVDRGIGFERAMSALQAATPDVYIRATDETLEILRWIRQSAAARVLASRSFQEGE